MLVNNRANRYYDDESRPVSYDLATTLSSYGLTGPSISIHIAIQTCSAALVIGKLYAGTGEASSFKAWQKAVQSGAT